MSDERAQEPGSNRALLLLIDYTDDLHALVRSGERRVLRWSSQPRDGACFSGDPAAAETYACAADARAVSAIIAMPDDAAAQAALHALRAVRPDAAVLVLSSGTVREGGDGTLVRAGDLRDVLRLDLEEELQRLEAQRRAFCLRRFAEGAGIVPILLHPDPDPDALSSALALRTLLDRPVEDTPIVTLLAMRRHENERMAELLHMRVTEVTREELQAFERLIAVDMQPADLFAAGGPRLAVVDHHPAEDGYGAEFRDVRPGMGAVATMMTQYLRAWDERRISPLLAAALLHGIRTDTDSLLRGAGAEDVEASAFLQERADLQLYRRLEKPSYTVGTARGYGRALAGLRAEDGMVVAHAGELDPDASHVLPEIADFCMGIDTVVHAAATGWVGDELVLTLRYAGTNGTDAGELARRIADEGGKGGGHATMARATLPRKVAEQRFGSDEEELPERLMRYLQQLAEPAAAALSRRS